MIGIQKIEAESSLILIAERNFSIVPCYLLQLTNHLLLVVKPVATYCKVICYSLQKSLVTNQT